jgi:hypothetical protein
VDRIEVDDYCRCSKIRLVSESVAIVSPIIEVTNHGDRILGFVQSLFNPENFWRSEALAERVTLPSNILLVVQRSRQQRSVQLACCALGVTDVTVGCL